MIKATEVLTKAQVKRVRSLQQKKFRVAEGLFVAEGDKCIEELMKGFRLEHLYREGENATRAEIEQMSSLRTPQGSIGIFRLPSREPITDNREPKILVMGNEGNGLSEEVRKLVTHKIRIPSYPKNVETSESLNVSIATGIILAYLRHM